jgi:peptide deformylase
LFVKEPSIVVVVRVEEVSKVIITDDKILRQPCIDVLPNEVGELTALLERELVASARPGIGLAAPQIGIHKRIAIVRINPHLRADLVNCRIAKQYDPMPFKGEGCLSIPDVSVDTVRYNEVYVVDNLGDQKSFVATGLMAVCIQHELDHLSGILMTDRKANKSKPKQRPNDFCACQSGKKFKKCCG